MRALQKEGAASRRAMAAKLSEAVGGKLESYYFAFGPDDAVGVVDLPDNQAAAAISVAANGMGLVGASVTPLLTVEEMDQAVTKSRALQPPGR